MLPLLIFVLSVTTAEKTDKERSLYGPILAHEGSNQSYSLFYIAQPWLVAEQSCLDNNAKLAVPKNEYEFNVIQSIVRKMDFFLLQNADERSMAWIGVRYDPSRKRWTTIDGDDILVEDYYHEWAGYNGFAQNYGLEADGPSEPHCAGVDPVNTGLRDYWCHLKMAYICQRN